jgi:hypothetical protein
VGGLGTIWTRYETAPVQAQMAEAAA